MSPIQQMLLGVGAVATKTYVDDIFSTFLYDGTGSSQAINNGINLSGEGGMTWIKKRTTVTQNHLIADTERTYSNGTPYYLYANTDEAQDVGSSLFSSFNNNGFTVGGSDVTNGSLSSPTYASWSFRKAPGFFDVVTYTGNATTRSISHSLGSVPGLILIKDLTSAHNWVVYHRSLGNESFLQINRDVAEYDDNDIWNSTSPTSTNFTINGNNTWVNTNNNSYVAYVFAGGEEGYNSVDFDGTGDKLSIADSSDLDFGSGDYTVECWFRQTGAFQDWRSILAKFDGTGSIWIHTGSGGKIAGGYNENAIAQQSGAFTLNTWNHVAISRSGTDWRLFLNGTQMGSTLTESGSNDNNHALLIGDIGGVSGREFIGNISNVRITKGQALYTSSFTPSTTPLTQTSQSATSSNVKLLCCNGDLATSSTVTPGTITVSGHSSSTGTSPFTSPDAVFGDAGDQNVIKCGSYVGNGSSTGPEINLGWEPSFILYKNSEESYDWRMYDSMRGIVTGGNDAFLAANKSDAENTGNNKLSLTATGFKVVSNDSDVNGSNRTIIYICIRRPDGYVGKPPELGTDVFAMDTGAGSSTMPNFDSGFPVDFQFALDPSLSNEPRYVGWRLTQGKNLYLNTADAESSASDYQYDSNVGWNNGSWGSGVQSWMWKRYAGLDVVAYTGNGTAGRQISHSLNKTIEMMWVKSRDGTYDWAVYHKGLNGGTNPQNYYLRVNTTGSESTVGAIWNDTAPTSSVFSIASNNKVNKSGDKYIALLFASVDGISKVGSYSGSSSEQTITLGFQPRFVIIKQISGSKDWVVLDTLRGWGSSSDNWLKLNTNTAQGSYNFGAPTSTGFTLTPESSYVSGSGNEFIYYAHA